jgi:hypothetical protein
MTPAERLARHAHEADRLAHDWPAWRDRPIPDGQPRAARTDGMPRSNDVSDPVLSTVIARDGMLNDEGGNLDRQARECADAALAIVLRLWRHAQGLDTQPFRPPTNASTVLVIAMIGYGLANCGRHPGRFGRDVVFATTVDRHATIVTTPATLLDAVGEYLTTLRQIIPATQAEPLAPADVPRCKVVPDCNRLAVRAMANGTLGCWTHYKHERGEMAS